MISKEELETKVKLEAILRSIRDYCSECVVSDCCKGGPKVINTEEARDRIKMGTTQSWNSFKPKYNICHELESDEHMLGLCPVKSATLKLVNEILE